VSQESTNHSFDELARGLASGDVSRRRALRLMGAALVGGTLASLGIGGEAGADPCKRTGKACKKNSQCCSRNCVNGTCAACPADTTLCGGNCVTNCPTGQTLNPSTCQCQCTSGTTLCDGNCVSTTCGPNQKFDTSSCTCVACVADGGTCTGNSDCCSDICDFSGFCLPRGGSTRIECLCENGNTISRCSRVSCLEEDLDLHVLICNSVCANDQGVTDITCTVQGC